MESGSRSIHKIICPKCSKEIKESDTNFCPLCGAQVCQTNDLDSIHLNVPLQQENHLIDSEGKGRIDIRPWAGFWIRLGAFWVDGLIIFLLAMFLGSLTYSTVLGPELFPTLGKINLFFSLLFIFYHALFLARFRTTPGKFLFGLAVIPLKKTTRFHYSEAFLRTLGYFISEFFLGIGFLWIAFDKHKQGWHDKIAKTAVIKKDKVPLISRFVSLILLTVLVIIMIALQFNLVSVYQSIFVDGIKPWRTHEREIVSVLVTQQEIRNGVLKEVITRAGPHIIKLPNTARDGDKYRVNRSEEEGGIFYIMIVVIERI